LFSHIAKDGCDLDELHKEERVLVSCLEVIGAKGPDIAIFGIDRPWTAMAGSDQVVARLGEVSCIYS
jgi:hypothetical protein